MERSKYRRSIGVYKMKITRYRITIEDLSTNAVQELPLSADAEHALISSQRLAKLLNPIDYRVTLETVDYILEGVSERVEINEVHYGLV